MASETLRWNITEHLGTEEKIAAYLNAVFEEGDPAEIRDALASVGRARAKSGLPFDIQPPE